MGTGVALTLGGGVVVCVLAFLAACAIDRTRQLLSGLRIPSFYEQAAGGFVATLIAVCAAATALEVNPSRVVTAGIVMLLAGIGLLGATQDAMTGFPITASARLINASLDTVGIIAGVAAGLTFGEVVGVEIEDFKPGASGLASASVTVLGASLAAAGFAFASYAPLRALVAVGAVGALGQSVELSVVSAGIGKTWGSAAAAITIGAVCYLVAGRFRVPPLVVVVPAIVPLLPGLQIYRGLALLAQGQDGVLQLASALGTAMALAAGVILGQYLASPLKREARRLETRLSGPRMVGLLLRRPGSRDQEPGRTGKLGRRGGRCAQGQTDQGQDDPEDERHACDSERHHRGEQRGLQERGVHRDRTVRVVPLELGVGLAAGDLLGVVVDDVGLAERGDRAVHVVTGRTVGVIGRP